jgi:riboflavin transporter FmnP
VSTKRLALIAMLVAQATILHYLEGLLPNPVPIPGVKLGLANIITLLALILYDFKTALNVVVLRTILGSLLNGTLFGVGIKRKEILIMVVKCCTGILILFKGSNRYSKPADNFMGVVVIKRRMEPRNNITRRSKLIKPMLKPSRVTLRAPN